MRMLKILQNVAVALATTGLLVPTAALAETRPTEHRLQLKVRDVALKNTVLKGQSVDMAGKANANQVVRLFHENKVVAETRTDQNGHFAISKVRGGVYVLASDDSIAVVRAWQDVAAPPAARDGILMTSMDPAVRGELPFLPGIGGLGGIGLGGALLAGTIATVVVVAATQSDGT